MKPIPVVLRALAVPGREATSSVLDEVTRLILAGELRAAGDRAAALMEDGVTDYRVVGAYLLGIFDQRGPEALPDILETLRASLSEHWQNVQPLVRKERSADSALSLLFRTIRSTIDFHEARRDETWKKWADALPHDLLVQISAATQQVGIAIDAVIEQSKSKGELGRLAARAEVSFRPQPAPILTAAPPAAGEDGAAGPPGSGSGDDEDSTSASVDAEDEAATSLSEESSSSVASDAESDARPSEEPSSTMLAEDPGPGPEPAQGFGYIEISGALETFVRKLQAFEMLVNRSEMGKAAIIAQDVRDAIEHFDPRVYLPALLTPYFRLLSEHIGEIAPHWETNDSPAWDVRRQLYQVDLDAFLAS